MSSKGGGGGGGREGEGSGVSIPDNVKKTIQSIREITGKQHSDEEIYAVLKECSMDPNETAQKLLHLDTFHEVKRKRDRKKETAGTQGRGGWGSRGSYYTSSDVGGGRNATARKENGVNYTSDRSSQKGKNNAAPHSTKTPPTIPNGTSNLPNGISRHGRVSQMSADGVGSANKDLGIIPNKPATVAVQPAVTQSPAANPAQCVGSSTGGQEKSTAVSNLSSTSVTSAAIPGVYSSASDPVLATTTYRHAGAVGTIKREIGRLRETAEVSHIQGNKHFPHDTDVSKAEKAAFDVPSSMLGKKTPSKSKVSEQVQQSKPSEPSLLQVVTSEVVAITVEANSELIPESNVPNGQHVTFPTHFQVSEGLKNGLTFGSFDSSFGQGVKHDNGNSVEMNSACPFETSQGGDETDGEPSSRSQVILPVVEGDNSDQSQSPRVPESDGNTSSDADLKVDQSNQEMHVHPEGNSSVIPNVPSYGFGFMPTSASHLAQFDVPEARVNDVSRLTNFASGNSQAPSVSSTPPVQNSIAAAPQAIHLFRQPFPPNYFPYPHYLPPFYMHPMHQFLNPTGLPQQPSTGSVYMPPGAASPGVKFSIPQYKPGTNTGNPAHLTIPSGYGTLTSPPVGFNLSVPSVTSGSSSSKDHLAASQLKENPIYTTGPLNEVSALWMAAAGQDLSNLPVNSLYNLSLHGQQFPFSPAQAGHGAFAGGLYQPPQTIAAPSNVNTLLQQSQDMAAAVENVVPPTVAYQQAQIARINWNTNC